jgi:hypothetical protein
MQMPAYNSAHQKFGLFRLIETLWTFVTFVLLKTSRSLIPNFLCPRNVMGKVNRRHDNENKYTDTITFNNYTNSLRTKENGK